ncbi:MAG TPA: TolC family protein, partial [Phycisphaerales bacterium]|nr:TolC family protein [Phycisphaerales bacterium]
MPKFTIHRLALLLLLAVEGCASPLGDLGKEYGGFTDENLLVGVNDVELQFPTQTTSPVEVVLQVRSEELLKITPANNPADWGAAIGINLQLSDATATALAMNDAIEYTIQNNLDVKIATFQPTIAGNTVLANEAAFDVVLGAGVSTKKSRIPQQQIVSPLGGALNSSESAVDIFDIDASLSKKLYGGGTVTLSTDITKTSSDSSGFNFTPDPAWQTVGTLNLTQPLLRNFGEAVTRAQIRLSEIVQGQAAEDVKDTLQTAVTASQQAYIDLELQWKILQVKQWLLEQGEAVVEILNLRREYDTVESDYAQAVATVQQRRAELISQQAAVQGASDTLKKLMNTTDYPLESEDVIQPTGAMQALPVSISLRQAIMTAMEHRPELRKLAMSIDSEYINMEVANNAMLPQLDLQAQMSFYGLGNNTNEGYQEVFSADFINYLAGLTFQVPLGNRGAEAKYKSARLQRMSAISSYKRGIQEAILDVKTSLRSIVTNAELMRANRAFRIAQAENLRALGVEEETMSGLTPTFLNLKLQTQKGLASARISEFTSIANYNKAIASLY